MLKGRGGPALTLQNGRDSKIWNFKGITDGVGCDSKQINFYYGTTLLNDKVTGDSFPEMPPSKTVVMANGDVSEIKVTPRWYCL